MRVDELPGGRKQPFYWTLVDVRDRPVQVVPLCCYQIPDVNLVRQTTYVAQSNVVPLATQVLHPDAASIFRKYAPHP